MPHGLQRNDLVYPELSYAIMGALFRVHRELGNRYQEKHYQRAIGVGFREACISYKEQVPVDLRFHQSSIGRYFVDFLIDEKIILEIKTVDRFTANDYRQVDGYLKTMGKELGILANFRTKELTFRRVLNPQLQKIR